MSLEFTKTFAPIRRMYMDTVFHFCVTALHMHEKKATENNTALKNKSQSWM